MSSDASNPGVRLMVELAVPIYALGLSYAQKLVADLPDERMCDQPVPGTVMNHAAFTLGHLAWTGDAGARLLGAPGGLAADWMEQYGMGAKPESDRSRYPAKDELLKIYEAAHARLAGALPNATDEILASPAPERMRKRFPTIGQMVLALMTSHEGIHLGQLSAWRRALGYPPVS